MQLREDIVRHAEQKLETRKELEELATAKQAMERAMAEQVRQFELSRVEMLEQHDAEQREFDRDRELQEDKMKEKLCAARAAVAFAVGSIDTCMLHLPDELYAQPPPGVSEPCSPSPRDLHKAKAMAEEAGADLDLHLQLWDEGEAKENTTAVKAKGNTEGLIVVAKKIEDAVGQAPRIERTPLSACNISW